MHEATRYAQALNLGKKYNPIHIAAQADSDQYSINHKELRCEVVARDERYSRIISCQMFMREYAKLVKMHRKAALEIEDKSKQVREISRYRMEPKLASHFFVHFRLGLQVRTRYPANRHPKAHILARYLVVSARAPKIQRTSSDCFCKKLKSSLPP